MSFIKQIKCVDCGDVVDCTELHDCPVEGRGLPGWGEWKELWASYITDNGGNFIAKPSIPFRPGELALENHHVLYNGQANDFDSYIHRRTVSDCTWGELLLYFDYSLQHTKSMETYLTGVRTLTLGLWPTAPYEAIQKTANSDDCKISQFLSSTHLRLEFYE